MKVTPQDTPIDFEFIGLVESSQQVEIRARVEGFLEKRLYQEGTLVTAGQPLFQMDRKPFEMALRQAKGELAMRQAQLDDARSNLSRVQPLVAKNAVSLKDLDTAVNQQKSAAAALQTAEGAVQLAELNLDYTLLSSPVAGVVGKALVQEGSYVSPALNSLLTSVARIDPILVGFSVSENELLNAKRQAAQGLLFIPENQEFLVEVELADGTIFPHQGHIDFTEPVMDPETGTYLVEAKLVNPDGALRPGQFVHVRLKGAYRPQAILVPQSAVTEGAQGPFVWVVDQKKAAIRSLRLGEWHGDQWFVEAGLQAGEEVVLDNTSRLAPGTPLHPETPAPGTGR